jgi:putative transposase
MAMLLCPTMCTSSGANNPNGSIKMCNNILRNSTGQQFKFSLINNGEDLSTYKSTQNDREYQFWERRPYKATMFNRLVLEQKLDCIHHNPVKADLCLLPEEYRYSSAGYYILNTPNEMITHYMDHI